MNISEILEQKSGYPIQSLKGIVKEIGKIKKTEEGDKFQLITVINSDDDEEIDLKLTSLDHFIDKDYLGKEFKLITRSKENPAAKLKKTDDTVYLLVSKKATISFSSVTEKEEEDEGQEDSAKSSSHRRADEDDSPNQLTESSFEEGPLDDIIRKKVKERVHIFKVVSSELEGSGYPVEKIGDLVTSIYLDYEICKADRILPSTKSKKKRFEEEGGKPKKATKK